MIIGNLFTDGSRKFRSFIGKKISANPSLEYLELHLTDHCNLNCRGCSHFSPIAEKWFAPLADYQRDIERLAELFFNIRKIRLLGGEPLLHPDVNAFITSTRKAFPLSSIVLVTNGILLTSMDESFWACCRKHHVSIDMTVYPPLAGKIKAIETLVRQNGIRFISHRADEFTIQRNLKGDSRPDKAMHVCREKFYCPFLREGKLYICALPALSHHYNNRFGKDIPSDGYADIHSPQITGEEILNRLNTPASVCRYCTTTGTEIYKWDVSRKEEWEWASTQDR